MFHRIKSMITVRDLKTFLAHYSDDDPIMMECMASGYEPVSHFSAKVASVIGISQLVVIIAGKAIVMNSRFCVK